MPQLNPNDFDIGSDEGVLAVFDDGQQDNIQLSQGEVGEIAELELGESGYGAFSEYFYVALGGIEETDNPYSLAAKVYGDLNEDEADTASATGTQIRIRVTDKQRDRTIIKTPWYTKDQLEGNAENNPRLVFGARNASMPRRIDRATWVREGRIIVVEARNQQGTTTVDRSGSALTFPFFGAK